MPDDDTLKEMNLARKIIRQAILDLMHGGHQEFLSVESYLKKGTWKNHLRMSGYPPELDSALRDAVVRSWLPRRILCREVLDALDEFDRKNEPRRSGVRFSP